MKLQYMRLIEKLVDGELYKAFKIDACYKVLRLLIVLTLL